MLKLIFTLTILLSTSFAYAYDATFNFTQQYPELVSGWKIKAGPTKGGPYPYIIDCKKPAANADGSFDCLGIGLTANPIYAVAVNYDSAGKESMASNEATMSITVQPPASLKVIVTVRTVSSLTPKGNIIAKTTVTSKEVSAGTVINTKPISYWNNKTKQYISQTTLVM